jgi:hypothetical protein
MRHDEVLAAGSFDRVSELDVLPGIDLGPVDLGVIAEDVRELGDRPPCPFATFTVDRTIGKP